MEAYIAFMAQRNKTISSLVYLLLSFPLGVLYFTLTIVGLALGLGTLVIWIGVPILFITFALVHGIAALECLLASNLLGIPQYQGVARDNEPRKGLLHRFVSYLTDPLTWTGIVYMIIKLPVGILAFVLTVVLTTVSLALTLMPFVYLLNLFIDAILLKSGIPSASYIIPYFIEIHGTFDAVMFARSFMIVPVGLLLGFVSLFVLKGLALALGELTLALLSPMHAFRVHTNMEPPAMPRDENQGYMYQEQRY